MVFTLKEGSYIVGQNHLSCIIDDTLHRDAASGGIIEVDSTGFMLTQPEAIGAEISVTYFQTIQMSGLYSVIIGTEQPAPEYKDLLWIKEVS